MQVSAIDALAGVGGRDVSCIVYGSDPLKACPISNGSHSGLQSGSVARSPTRSLCCNQKLKLAVQMLTRRWPADVAVCWHLAMLKLLPFARGFKGKVVVFLHGIEAWRPQSAALVNKLQRVDLFLSNSDFTWNEFLKFVPQVKNTPHITTPLGFGMATAERIPVPAKPSALIIARMNKAEDYKGHREIIDAWPQVLRSLPEARLNIVGEGNLRPDLEQMVAERSLTKRVVFHGRIDEAAKAKLLRECSAFVMPSRAEGFGIVYLESDAIWTSLLG